MSTQTKQQLNDNIMQLKAQIDRLDKFVRSLDILIEMCDLAAPFANHYLLPAEYRYKVGQDLDVIMRDFYSLKDEARSLADELSDQIYELEKERKLGKDE